MKKLSPRQERVLRFIGEFIEERGLPPTVRDIQYACDISSTSVVDYNLNILQREGHIRRSPEISRGIELLGSPRTQGDVIHVPLLGYISAGQPVPVMSSFSSKWAEPIEILEIASSQINGEHDLYALRVRGTSMIDALIDDGDIVVVKPTDSMRNGDMVIAWLKKDKEATLKKLYHEGKRIRLQPANRQMEAIFVAPKDVEIQGKVVTVLRDYS